MIVKKLSSKIPLALALTMLMVLSASCGIFRGSGGVSTGSIVQQESEDSAQGPQSRDAYEQRLRALVSKAVSNASDSAEARQSSVIRRSPYYFREYSLYPKGAASADFAIRETESRTAPYVADVIIEKTRFATRLHRRRDEAQGDLNFLRDTGTETITYEMRNGRWVRVGSLFIAERTEESINGEWVPVEEIVQRTIAAEEEAAGGWWQRVWGRVRGI
jgi:hypothetical protein